MTLATTTNNCMSSSAVLHLHMKLRLQDLLPCPEYLPFPQLGNGSHPAHRHDYHVLLSGTCQRRGRGDDRGA